MLKNKRIIYKITLICFCINVYSQTFISSLHDLKLWLKADSAVTMSSGKISSWDDISGNNYSFIQTNLPSQPTFSISSSTIHKPYLYFDGSNKLQSTNNFSFSDCSIFCVSSQNTGDNAYGRLLDHDFSTGFWLGRSGTLNEFGGGFYESSPPYGNFTSVKNDTAFVFSLIRNGGVAYSYINKTPFSVTTRTTISSPTNPKVITIGGDISNNFFGNKNIYEIIIIDTVVTPTEQATIENYLINKYAPPVNLGPDINMANTVCKLQLKDLNDNYYKKILWNTGETTASINITTPGVYSVIATNIFNVVSYDTINVQYSTPNNYNITSYAFCSGSNLEWNTNLPKNQFSFQWQDNSIDSVFNINQSGNYYVKITDSFGCSITSDTAYITIDNFSSTASLGPDLSLCAGNSISLVSGVTPSLTYTWSTGSNNDSLLINNTGQYSVIITNTNNCVAKDTINITVAGQAPVANFTSSIGCKNNAVSFTDLSVPPSGNTINSYDWNFGDLSSGSANTSTLSNPFHTFSDTGNYSITLKVITNIGCEQSVTKTIHIAPKPIVNFTVGLSCQNDSTSFFGSITNPGGYTTSSLKWNFGDPSSGGANNSTLISPKHLFSNSTNYTIKLIATNNAGCKDSLTNIIAVKGQVKADFTYSSACTNTATLFQDNSIVPAPNSSNIRSWNFGTSTASGLTVSKSYTNSGVYSVTLSVTGNNGCNSSISKVITIFNPPVTSFSIPTFCAKDTITINNSSIAQSGIISSYNWKLNNSSFSSIQNPTLSISSAGNYSVSLTTTNNFGCRDSLTKTIMVNPLPIVDFSTNPALYYYINEPVVFIPSINNANFYFWNISSTPTTTIQSPTVSFNNQGTYTASLLLQDQQGCKNSISKNLTVAKRFLDIGVLNVNSSKDADGFVTAQTDIVNYGTIPAYAIELNYQVSDGGNIKETWTGTLTPNNYFTYNFNSKVSTQSQRTNHITCVNAKKVNGITDENAENNKLCSALNSNDISISNPIPNPTSSDIVLPVILNKDLTFSISIYNSTGQIIYEEPSQNGLTGLNLITIPSSNYARGCYIIKTVIDDKIFIKKFIKIGNE